MIEYLPLILAALAALFAIGWYIGDRRGYARGRAYALAGNPVAPSLAGGPGAVPR